MRDHSRSSITSGSSTARRRKACRSVRSELPEHLGVAAVVLGAGDREAVTEAVELLGIDRKDLKAALQQRLDHRSARRLDRHRDLRRLGSRRFQQPIAQLRQPGPAMASRRARDALALGIEQADTVLCSPSRCRQTNEARHHLPSSDLLAGHRDARRSLYWRSRRNLPLDVRRGQSAGAHVLRRCSRHGGQWVLPADRPIPPVYNATGSERQDGTGWAKRAHERYAAAAN